MNTTLNTQNLSLCPPVGQLDKTPIYSLETNKNKPLRVGRHKNKTSHTSQRTHEQTYTPDLEMQKLILMTDLDLKTYLLNYLTDQLPEFDLYVHNANYLEQIQQKYQKSEYQLFVYLLRFFALQRNDINTQYEQINTNESDFLKAFRTIKEQKYYHKTKNIRAHQKQQVLDYIHSKREFPSFCETEVCKRHYLTYQQVENIFCMLIREKIIEKTAKKTTTKRHRLFTKSFSYVAGA